MAKSATKSGPGRTHSQGEGPYGVSDKFKYVGGYTGAKLNRAIYQASLTKKH